MLNSQTVKFSKNLFQKSLSNTSGQYRNSESEDPKSRANEEINLPNKLRHGYRYG